MMLYQFGVHTISISNASAHKYVTTKGKEYVILNIQVFNILNTTNLHLQWIVPQFLNLRPKMANSIVYVITLITNRNHAFHCLN